MLDDTWRQVIRHFYNGDIVELIGPAHDDLLIATKEQPTGKPDSGEMA